MATFVGNFILALLLIIALEVTADLEPPQVFYDWTVSYSRRAPLGVEKQVSFVFNCSKDLFSFMEIMSCAGICMAGDCDQ